MQRVEIIIEPIKRRIFRTGATLPKGVVKDGVDFWSAINDLLSLCVADCEIDAEITVGEEEKF